MPLPFRCLFIAFCPPLPFRNQLLPTVPTFAVRETDVSRHNGGTSGAPLKPLRDDSQSLEQQMLERWTKIGCETATVGQNRLNMHMIIPHRRWWGSRDDNSDQERSAQARLRHGQLQGRSPHFQGWNTSLLILLFFTLHIPVNYGLRLSSDINHL